jgi:hypothetical protein
MKNESDKILQIANRRTFVKLTVEFTKEIDKALDKVVADFPKVDDVAITKENVIVAATESYLEVLRRIENNKSRKKRTKPADKTSPVANQRSLPDFEKTT